MKVKFYCTASGRSPVEEFIAAQSDSIKSGFFDALNWLSSGKSMSMPLSRNLISIYKGLYELRLRDKKERVRIFYYIKKDEAIYLLHAYKKKTRVIPKKELLLVQGRIKEV